MRIVQGQFIFIPIKFLFFSIFRLTRRPRYILFGFQFESKEVFDILYVFG